MGHITNHAIIVQSHSDELITAAREKAVLIFSNVSDIIATNINAEYCFFIPPDGIKDGWEESEVGDKQRKAFMDWCDYQANEDGSNSLQAVEMFYHDENNKAGIVRHTGIEYT